MSIMIPITVPRRVPRPLLALGLMHNIYIRQLGRLVVLNHDSVAVLPERWNSPGGREFSALMTYG